MLDSDQWRALLDLQPRRDCTLVLRRLHLVCTGTWCKCHRSCLFSIWVSVVVLHTHSSEGLLFVPVCVWASKCDPSFFLLWVLMVIVGISVKQILKDTNKSEKSQTVAAVCFCLRGETAEMWLVVSHRVRAPCWLWFISDELCAGLPLSLCPTGGTSHRWHYFNLSPWQRHRWGFHCCRHHWISFLPGAQSVWFLGSLDCEAISYFKGCDAITRSRWGC